MSRRGGDAGLARSAAVTTPPAVHEHLPADDAAPGIARRAVERLRDGIGADALERVKLLVSELVTNSVCHAGLGPDDRVELTAATSGRALRVEVRDAGPGFSVPGAPPPDSVRGRGLVLVDAMADRWGVAPGDGTTVWFEIDAA